MYRRRVPRRRVIARVSHPFGNAGYSMVVLLRLRMLALADWVV